MNSVQTNPISNERYVVGSCYAIIPGGVDRDTYVEDCLRRSIITVQIEDGSHMFNIPVGYSILKEIDFPEEIEQLGSQLIYVTYPIHNKPVIIDRILKDDEATSLSENEFRLEKFTSGGSVSISGKGKDGNLFINVEGKTEGGGKMYIDVSGPENTGEIIVNLKGDLNAEMQNLNLNILNQINVTNKEGINVDSDEVINFGSENLEPAAKANTLVSKLGDMLDGIVVLTVPTAFGPSGVPINASTFTQIKALLDEIKSKLVNLE